MVARTSVVFAVEWYDAEINAGVAAYAREAGWILYDYRMYSDIEGMALDVAGGWTGDGVIALVNHANSSIARLVRGVRAPVVDLVNEAPELPLPRVVADNRAIGAMAAGYLMEIGYEHLAFQRMFRANVVDDRMAGFRDAVLQEGSAFTPSISSARHGLSTRTPT